jgi:hypothetical protein
MRSEALPRVELPFANSPTGQSLAAALAAIRQEADSKEAEDHHRPGGEFGDISHRTNRDIPIADYDRRVAEKIRL